MNVDTGQKVQKRAVAADDPEKRAPSPSKRQKVSSSKEEQSQGGPSDASLIEAINAVVTFSDEITGEAKVLVAQPSDVAFLVSDAIFQPLLRRIAVEILALEEGVQETPASLWHQAPCDAVATGQFAEARGYLIDEESSDESYRKTLLTEAASDLMITRMQMGRSLSLAALAGPPGRDAAEAGDAEELAGVATTVAGSEAAQLAGKLIGGICQKLDGSISETDISARPWHELLEQTTICASADSQGLRTTYPGQGLVLHGGWSLLQEMQVREVASTLQREYTVRRHILLRRLDVSVEAMSASSKARPRDVQQRIAGILGAMWAGWRRSAEEAPALSEWSVLAASQGVLARAVSQRVTHSTSATASKIKKVRIGSVPDRGGVPEGYGKDAQRSATSSAVAAASTSRTPGRGLARPSAPGRLVSAGEPAASASAGSAAAASSSGQSAGTSAAGQTAGQGAQVAPAQIAAKRQREPGNQTGARSTNKDLESEWKKKLKEDREGGTSGPSYWQALAEARGQEGFSKNLFTGGDASAGS